MENKPAVISDADSAWQSLNNVCDDLDDTVTPNRRKSRRSWFETPPVTKLDISMDKKKRRSSGVGKRKSVENMETLLLTHFTNPPKVSFGKIKLGNGKSRTRHLLVKNPHDYEQEVVIEKFPYKKKFTTDSKTFSVPAEDCIVLTMTWCPEEDGNYREMVLFRVDGAYRLQAFLLGTAEQPKPLRKHRKGLLGAKVKKPFSILNTPGLACIRDNYSPQDDDRQLFVPGKFRVLQENIHIQNQHHANIVQCEQTDYFPPPVLESTAIAKDDASSACRSSAYNKFSDIGCSPTLPVTSFSPIPQSGPENAFLVDSFCSILQTSPIRDTVVTKENPNMGIKADLEPRGPNIIFTSIERREVKNVESRETILKTIPCTEDETTVPASPKISPQSFLNNSLKPQTKSKDALKRKALKQARSSWTPIRVSPKKMPDGLQTEKIYLSPDSFLNDSIVASQIGSAITPGTPYIETAPAFNHEEFEKSIISPNSFLEELNSTRNNSLTSHDPDIPSPSSVLNDSVPHNVLVQQLSTMRNNLQSKKSKLSHTKKLQPSSNINFGEDVKAKQEPQAQRPSRLMAPTLASSRRATFVTKKSDKVQDRFSATADAPSPRRATFLVAKKNQYGSRKASPKDSGKGQKKMTRSQRYSNIHQAEHAQKQPVSKTNKRRSLGKGENVNKTRMTKTGKLLDAFERSPNNERVERENESEENTPISSGTVTKAKPFLSTADNERSSTGRQLFSEDSLNADMSEDAGNEQNLLTAVEEIREDMSRLSISKERPSTIEKLNHSSGKKLFESVEVGNDGKTLSCPEAKTDDMKVQEIMSDLQNTKFGSPSKMMNDVLLGEMCVGRMSMTVTKGRPSLSTITESESGEMSSKASSLSETPKSTSQNVSGLFRRQTYLTNKNLSGKKLFEVHPMSPSKSPILSSIFRDIGSPNQIPSSPDVEVSRRITLTVTKSKPSDALLEATEAASKGSKTDSIALVDGDDKVFVSAKEETFVTVAESKEGYNQRKKILRKSPSSENASYNFTKVDVYEQTISNCELQTLKEQTQSWEVSISPKGKPDSNSYTLTSPIFSVTPHALPTSPLSENSRRSTHVIKQPKVIDAAAQPRRLFPPLGSEENEDLVMGQLDEKLLERQSSATSNSVSSAYSADSLETRHSTTKSDHQSQGSDSEVDALKTEEEEFDMIDSVFVRKDSINEPVPDTAESSEVDEVRSSVCCEVTDDRDVTDEEKKEHESMKGVLPIDKADEVRSSVCYEVTADREVTNEENKEHSSIEGVVPIDEKMEKEAVMEPWSSEILKGTITLVKAEQKQVSGADDSLESKKRRKLKASKTSPTSGNRPSSVSPELGVINSNQWFVSTKTTEKDKCGSDEKVSMPRKVGLNIFQKKRSMTEDKENVHKQNDKKRSKSDPSETSQSKKSGFLARLTSTGKKKKPPAKGLAQSKLILVKKSKTGMPKHPMPFAAKNMYYDERWIEKQDRGFVHWLNFVLTPPDEYNQTATKTKVDAGSLNIDFCKVQTRLAPTKEVLSIRAYTARRRMNRLRRSACQLYQSNHIVSVIVKLEYEVEKKRVCVRKDRMLHADIGIKQKILDMLLCYNPLWLRVGLETIFGEILPLQSNSDVIGLSRFILFRFLGNPDISEEYAHPTVPHLYRDGYAEAIAKHSLKKFLLLVYFLDQAKTARLIQHDPCLFCKDADIKASKDLLIQFSRDYLRGEGDITKHLAYFGYTVSHVQSALDEFDYAVTQLGVDLRDGLRLSRVIELLTGQWGTVQSLRAPAISRLQKVHNIEMVFKCLADRGLHIATIDGGKIGSRDIVDGHREKTLRVLWHLIFHFQVDVLINLEQLQEEITLLEQSLKVKINMQKLLRMHQPENKARRDSGGLMSQDNERLELLLKWCRVVCLHYGVKVENFTVSFSDGRALCCLLHYYHPALLPLDNIHLRTTQSVQQDLEEQEDEQGRMNTSEDWSFQYGTGLENPDVFEELLANEKENFKTLYERVSELGGIPLMLRASDMSNTIPDEKVVVTYVSYLCGRLLDIREESRAARVIQIAWKRYRLRQALIAQQHEVRAACVIQRHARDFLSRLRSKKESQAAIVLQTVWRGQRARRQIRLLKLTRENANTKSAALKVQAVMQTFAAQRQYRRLRAATVTLQTHVRGHLARKHLALQHKAAAVIQSNFRAHLETRKQREEYLVTKGAAVILQRAFRHKLAQQNASRTASSIVLQNAWRRHKHRKQFVDLKQSALVLQKYIRMSQARQRFQSLRKATVNLQKRYRRNTLAKETRKIFLKQRQSATLIQAHVRGYLQQQQYIRLKKATVCMQKYFRGHKYWLKFQAMRLAAVMIQRAYRFHKMAAAEREMLKRKMSACITLQRWWRRLKQLELVRRTAAATVIQSVYRKCVIQKRYRNMKAAAVVVQKNVRMMQAKALYKQKILAVSCLQHHVKSYLKKKHIRVELMRKERAATRIQAYWKMCLRQRHYKSVRSAVVLIQSHVRGWKQKTTLLQQKRAAETIQMYYRAFQSGRTERYRYRVMLGAIMTIQNMWRSYRIRKFYKLLCQSAIKIQSWSRKVQAKTHFKKVKRAAVVIQSFYRARKAREHYEVVKSSVICLQAFTRTLICRRAFVIKRNAAINIQSRLRMFQAQKCYQRKKAACITIQRQYRAYCVGQTDRKKYLHTMCKVIKLQANVRGYMCRKAAKRKMSACITLQRWWRRLKQQELVRRTAAATVIQSVYRKCVIQKRYRNMKAAAVVVQKNVRMMQAKALYKQKILAVSCLQHHVKSYLKKKHIRIELMRKERAATRIQAYWKMCLRQRHYKSVRSAVVLIQSHVRSWKQKTTFLQQKSAAETIQMYYRAFQSGRAERYRYRVMLGAIMTIQNMWRSYRIRKFYKLLCQSAIKIQSWSRKVQAKTHFKKVKRAAVVIQSFYRARKAREHYEVVKSSVICLQAFTRTLICRRAFVIKRNAAINIQSRLRMFQAQKCYQRKKAACITIQRQYRAYCVGQTDRKKYFHTMCKVIKLQANVRGYMCRKAFLKTRWAAVTIQKNIRMQQQKVRFAELRETERRIRSAVKLQTRVRMLIKRREYQGTREAVTKIQQWYRSMKLVHRTRHLFLVQKGAAITIQAVWQGHVVRSHLKTFNKSATLLQAQFRGYRQRIHYQNFTKAAVRMQQCYRRSRLAKQTRQNYESKRKACIVLQKSVRMFLSQKSFLKQKDSAIIIERAYRCYQQRVGYLQMKSAALVIQKRWRATLLAKQERELFLRKKRSVILLQGSLRGYLARKYACYVKKVIVVQSLIRCYQARKRHQNILKSILHLQNCFRARAQRQNFLKFNQAVETIQQRWRERQAAQGERRKFLIQVGAVITIQQGYRSFCMRKHYLQTRGKIVFLQACVRRSQQRRQYVALRQAAYTLQHRYRQKQQARRERQEFLHKRKSVHVLQTGYRSWKQRQIQKKQRSAITIQSMFRRYLARKFYHETKRKVVQTQAIVRGFLARHDFKNKLESVRIIQRNIRTFLLFNNLRHLIVKCKKAAQVIQRAYRSHRHLVEKKKIQAALTVQSQWRMIRQRTAFQKTLTSLSKIQATVRGWQVRKAYRKTLHLHQAAKCLQSCYRGYQARKQFKKLQEERQIQLQVYAERARLHLAALKIQTWFKRCQRVQRERRRLASAIVIQRRVRMFLERLHYLKLRQSTLQLQACCRRWLEKRQQSAAVIQRCVRNWLYRQRQHKLQDKVAKIQACWRGYQTRKKITCKKVQQARERCLEANQNVSEEKKLGNRTTSALDYLLEYKSLVHILEALMHLDVATRLSPRCCERLVEVHAVHVIYRLIRSCNRSLPHMELIKYSINILLNLAKYDKTVHAVHDVESTEILVDLMQIYRDKGSAIFAKTCALLGILGLDPRRRMEILLQTRVVDKIRSIHTLVVRKHKVEERQRMVKAKMAAARSFNSTLPLSTPVKRRRIRPEWMLKRDSLHTLMEPLPAVNFVMENLHLSSK